MRSPPASGLWQNQDMNEIYRDFLIRDWQPSDRQIAADLIQSVLAEYGLGGEPEGADRDVLQVEADYWATGGKFWVVERLGQVVGTGGYYPIARGENAVEIRKMYLLPAARGHGLGRYLLAALERDIAAKGFTQVWIETASVLKQAVRLYESCGYLPSTGVETARCDRIYYKQLTASLPLTT
ncbi:MAG TPA: GNAT family N-acetyltransferase [Coleofasciculaceae cyanobacterium]